MASTVKQTTLMPPTTPPMMGPRGTDLSGVALMAASLIAEESGIEVGASLVGINDDVVGGSVVEGVFKALFDEESLDCVSVDEVVDELVDWTVDDDEVVVADIDGGFA